MNRILSVAVLALAAMQAHATNTQTQLGRGFVGKERERSLLQTYDRELSAGVTPVTRVVNLLKEMTETLNKEMEEDEGLYKKLSCWCNDNVYEKKLSSDANKAKIEELTHT